MGRYKNENQSRKPKLGFYTDKRQILFVEKRGTQGSLKKIDILQRKQHAKKARKWRIGQLPATQQLQRNRRVFPLLVLVLPTRLPRDEVEVDGKKEEEKADAVSRIWFLPAMPPTKRGFVDGIPSVLWSLCTKW